MTLVHNRCVFANKQQIKMQETPDAIPEGETPHTVSMCVFDSLVDEAKPGDRVEITGVYRAVPIRAAPNMRILKAVYKTYVDVIHVRKDAAHRIANTAGREDREDLGGRSAGDAVAAGRSDDDDAEESSARRDRDARRARAPTPSFPPSARVSGTHRQSGGRVRASRLVPGALDLGDGGGEERAFCASCSARRTRRSRARTPTRCAGT